jgi:hypothetical protein
MKFKATLTDRGIQALSKGKSFFHVAWLLAWQG